MDNELTTDFDLIPDGEDTLVVAKLADLFIERSYRYYELLEDLRGEDRPDKAILERRHKMPRSHYEGMARYIWGAAKQSNIQDAHTPKTLLAIICGPETESFLEDSLTKEWKGLMDPRTMRWSQTLKKLFKKGDLGGAPSKSIW